MKVNLSPGTLACVQSLAEEAGIAVPLMVAGIVDAYFTNTDFIKRAQKLVGAIQTAVDAYHGTPAKDAARSRLRAKSIDWDHVRERFHDDGVSLRELASEYGVSPSTIHRHL